MEWDVSSASREKWQRRVVVTGMGAVTPMGIGVVPSWAALCRGESPIRLVSRFDTSHLRTRMGGEIADLVASDFMEKRIAMRFDRFIVLALVAGRMAAEDAKFGRSETDPARIGVVIGNCLGGAALLENGFQLMRAGQERKLSPFFIPGIIGSSAAGMVAINLGCRGPNFAVNSACSSGADALGCGVQLIRSGAADAVIAGGSEAPITPLLYAGFGAMRATSARNGDPGKASRPFDKERDGFVPAEGAAVLVLEELGAALRREARIYGEIAGYGTSCDAYHITAPDPKGEGAAACMTRALADAGISAAEIDYVNAHGTSTQLNDLSETRALKAVFGQQVRGLPISANKSMTGHTIAAAGALEAIFSILSIQEGIVPPTINYENPDPELDLDYVPNTARKMMINTVLSNSFGFGGTNASLVITKWEGNA